MKTQYAAVAALVAGIAIGASLIQVLQAQTKNPSGNNRIGPCRQGRASSQAICCS
jgi:hypothetical protein